MYLHTGVKRVCTKNVTLTHNYKEKAFSFLHLQVLKKLCTEKRAWWRDSTLETNLQSQYGLNEASANKEKKKIFSKVTLSWRSELQIVFPLKNQPRCILSTVQHQGVFNVLAKRIFKKTARGLIHQKWKEKKRKKKKIWVEILFYLKHVLDLILKRCYDGNRQGESMRWRKVESWRRAACGGPARGFLQQQLHHKLSLDGHTETDQARPGFPAIVSYRDEEYTSSSKTLACFLPLDIYRYWSRQDTKQEWKKKGRMMATYLGVMWPARRKKKEIIITCKWMLMGVGCRGGQKGKLEQLDSYPKPFSSSLWEGWSRTVTHTKSPWRNSGWDINIRAPTHSALHCTCTFSLHRES